MFSIQVNNLKNILSFDIVKEVDSKKQKDIYLESDFKNSFDKILEKIDSRKKNQEVKKTDNKKVLNSKVEVLDTNDIDEEKLESIVKFKDILSSKEGLSALEKIIENLNKEPLKSKLSGFDNPIEGINSILSSRDKDDIDVLNEFFGLVSGVFNIVPPLNENIDTNDYSLDNLDSLENISADFYMDQLNDVDDSIVDFLKSLDNTQNVSKEELSIFGKKLLDIFSKGNLEENTSLDNLKEDIQVNNVNLNIKVQNEANLNVGKKYDNPLMNKVIESIQDKLSALDLDKKSIELRLKIYPRNLGEITISIERDNNILNIKLHSENLDVKDMLKESMPQLKDELNKFSGMNVSVDVSRENKDYNKNNDNSYGANYKSDDAVDTYMDGALLKVKSSQDLVNRILDIII